MRGRAPSATALTAGLAIVALGILLVLDRGGKIDLGFAYLGPALIAALGLILLIGGLAHRQRRG